ncbi:MAG: hypothetical protein CME71_04155 [Halobacteriovorax sp.]|mgnify:CR=1 FL=1|nr:hypothetical protein [Halobacteriovorax sp.]
MSDLKPWFLAKPIAHRGLHKGIEIPENSLAAFDAACKAGFPIELDCHYHEKSGEIIVFHDVDLLRLAQDPRTVQELNLNDLLKVRLYESDHLIPSLEQVLELVAGRVPLLIETKQIKSDGAFEKALVAQMDRYVEATGGEWAIQSFHHGALYYIERHFPHVAKGMLAGSMNEAEIPAWQRVSVKSLALLPLVRPQFIAFEAAELVRTKKVLPWARAFGTPVIGWTIRNKKEYKSVKGLCDNVIFENFLPEHQ